MAACILLEQIGLLAAAERRTFLWPLCGFSSWFYCSGAKPHSPPREEGCLRHQEISAKPALAPQTGWSLASHVSARATTFLAGCALSSLRGLRPAGRFAVTPPHEEGDY